MNCHCCSGTYTKILEDVYKCNDCRHVYRKFNGNSIEYHQNQYRKDERRTSDEISITGEIKEKFHENRKTIVTRRMEFIGKYISEEMSCLDIGSGAGTFARKLSEKTKTVECTELDPNLINECKRLGFKTYDEDILVLETNKQYDFISAWHVLEHIEDINLFVEKVKQKCKKILCIEVPLLKSLNGEGRVRKLEPPNGSKYDGHTHYFSKESFKKLFEGRFEILEIKEGVQTPALFAVLRSKNDN